MVRVLFIQTQIKQYRLPFFIKLHAALLQDGIEVKVAYSDPPGVDKLKQDNVELPEDIGIRVPGYRILGGRFLYQALMRHARTADLVITEQANKNLHNYVFLSLALLLHRPLAFWGQGENQGLGRSGASELIRPWVARRAAWWFTYTKGTAAWLRAIGFPRERTTVLNNSTDTRTLAAQVESITDEQLAEARQRLRIEHGGRVGIYCGILAPAKGIKTLLEATRLVRERIPNFHLLILGGGPELETVMRATSEASWIHYLGPKFGEEKALLLKMSDCFLLPGYVGLAILDSFAAGLPLITTNLPFHAPEVEYLEEGVNGRMTDNHVEAYAKSVTEVLSKPALLEHLKVGGRAAGKRYSIEAMVERCRLGILECLNVTGLAVKVGDTTPAYSGTDRG